MVCYEYVKSGGWHPERKIFLKFEKAVDYAVNDLQYKYMECLATMDEVTLDAHYVNPDEMKGKLKSLKEYLMHGWGHCGLMSEYYEIHKIEVVE